MSPAEKLWAGEILFRERERQAIAEILQNNPSLSRQNALELFEQQLAAEDEADQVFGGTCRGVLNP